MHLTRRHFLGLAASAPLSGIASAQSTPVTEPPPFNTIAVGDIDVGYRIEGEGEPLLLIMGFAGAMDAWDPTLLSALAARYQIITFDNRGMGTTSAGSPYNFTQLADDARELVNTLGFERVNLFGWSMGAMIALDLAIRHREIVRKVILHAGDIGGPDAVSASSDVIGNLIDTSGTEEEVRQRQIELLLPPEWVAGHRDYVDMVFSRPSTPVSNGGVLRQANALLDWYSQRHAVASVRVPALIVHGTEDIIIPVANAQLLAEAIPGSWLIRLPGGHGVHYQFPNEIAAMSDVFLQTGT